MAITGFKPIEKRLLPRSPKLAAVFIEAPSSPSLMRTIPYSLVGRYPEPSSGAEREKEESENSAQSTDRTDGLIFSGAGKRTDERTNDGADCHDGRGSIASMAMEVAERAGERFMLNSEHRRGVREVGRLQNRYAIMAGGRGRRAPSTMKHRSPNEEQRHPGRHRHPGVEVCHRYRSNDLVRFVTGVDVGERRDETSGNRSQSLE